MEEDLDRIAQGEGSRVEWLRKFYFGHDGMPGLNELSLDLGAIDAREVSSIDIGEGIAIRTGRYGTYIEQGEGDDRKRANVPDSMAPDELTLEVAKEYLAKPSGERYLGVHPETGLPVVAKDGKFGPYVSEVLPETAKRGEKPRTGSLFKTMSLDTIDIDTALKLLDLPRSVGADSNGEVITAQNGPFGPYLRRGSDTRPLPSEEAIFTITTEEALHLLAQPRTRGRGTPKPPLAELGVDEETGRNVIVKDGRFGPYVTDGETNANLGRGDDISHLTLERGLELLAIRRAKDAANGGPVKKGAKRATKKAAPKKAAKKTAKKATKKAAKKAAPKAPIELPADEVRARK
jgi:DNA topoisomerase I